MTDRPWENEPDSLTFEAEGLPCAMRRGVYGVWCGYVGVGPEHPLFGLPYNHPLKLPPGWFAARKPFPGSGSIDIMLHALGGKPLEESCQISLALEVHGGVSFAGVPEGASDAHWWFGFDCAHAGDYLPRENRVQTFISEMIESMPKEARETMRRIMNKPRVYRDQQYVVSECQSLAAQLIAIVKVIEQQQHNQRSR